MAISRVLTVGALVCVLALGTSATRELTQIPQYQGSGLNLVNGADPSAQQANPANPTPVPTQQAGAVPTLQNSLNGVQAQAPAPVSGFTQPPSNQPPVGQPPLVLPQAPAPAVTPPTPMLSTPAPAPSNPLPTTTVPVPAPAPPVLPTVPAPSPAKIPTVAPVPAPQLALPSLVPTPAPVPAPAPQPFPECGVRPSCRLFMEDMLCCDNAGALTSKQYATLRLQCTHPVNYYPKCFNVTGPTNMTAFNQFENTTWSRTHMAQINMLDDYMGNVSINIEGPRTDANLSADCGLYVSPCMYGGEIIRQIAPVQGLSFTAIPTEDFMEVSNSVNDDINNLDSLVFGNPSAPGTCQQQNLGNLNATFFTQDWFNYTSGFQNQCNYTAFTEVTAMLSPSSSSVQTSSLG